MKVDMNDLSGSHNKVLEGDADWWRTAWCTIISGEHITTLSEGAAVVGPYVRQQV